MRTLADSGLEQRHLNFTMATEQPSLNDRNPIAVVGRIPNSTWEKLETGFGRLENILKSLSEETGLPVLQIINLWSSKEGRHLSAMHLWNIYQTYLKENADEELNSTFGDTTKRMYSDNMTFTDDVLMPSTYSA